MAQSTWDGRDLTILEAVRQAEVDRTHLPFADAPDLSWLAERIESLNDAEVAAGVRDLAEANPPYLKGSSATTHEGFDMLSIRLSERGRRAVEQWPSGDEADLLLQILREHVDSTNDPDERSRIRQATDVLSSMTREVLTGVLTSWARQASGLQ